MQGLGEMVYLVRLTNIFYMLNSLIFSRALVVVTF